MAKSKSANPFKEKKADKVISDFQSAYAYASKNTKEVRQDYEYYLGKQWTDEENQRSLANGNGNLTQINNIRPYVNLVSGYERQNRNDIIAYPEGDEDSLQAEIVTRLIKNTMKLAKGEFKLSDCFNHGNIGGSAALLPFMDYNHDLIHGKMFFKLLTGAKVFPDPNSEEYDMSDAMYVTLFKEKLTKDQLLVLFPEHEDKIEKISQGRIPVSNHPIGDTQPFTKYYFRNNMPTNDNVDYDPNQEYVYDLLIYYYKRYQTKYYLINLENNGVIDSFNKEEIEALKAESDDKAIPTRLVTKRESIIYELSMVGDVIIKDEKGEFSDYWKEYPIIPFVCYFCQADIPDKAEFARQGIVRGLKAPQREKNVARTHAARHITSTTNSGWLAEEKSFVNKKEVQRLGSKNGAIIEYKKGSNLPQRIEPALLSQGFTFLAEQNTQDFKHISGINAELLSVDTRSESGRAILLRQRQGLVMIQSILDNFKQTYEIMGRFLVATLPIVYTVDRAMKVLGQAFLLDAFGKDIVEEDRWTGEPVVAGREIDKDEAYRVIEATLKDKELSNYNISIGEGVNSETVKFTNFITLDAMAKNGYPIPPDVLIDESNLNNATKEKVKNSIKQSQQAQGATK